MATKKKNSFTGNNPAMMFISAEPEPEARQQDTTPDHIAPAPEGYKINPIYIETKSKRVNLLLQPSLAERLRAAAAEDGTSVNEMAAEAIRQYLKNRKGD